VILSAHQPAYLPWLGYFDKIARADVFVYLDTVQFEKNSFINRNRIKTPQGPLWLTIPVKIKDHLATTLRETEVDGSRPWSVKHLKTIAMNYSRAQYFSVCFPKLEALLAHTPSNLADLCWRQLQFWLMEFRITTRVVRSSELSVSGSKSDLILELCRHFGSTNYLSGRLGRDYLRADDFAASGITLEYQHYTYPVYPQLWGEFLPHMSILDFWMNCGPDSRQFAEHQK
jgi:hypothetical protein